jgi:photosystem II stability/assembly factor-like uncharacterized protein
MSSVSSAVLQNNGTPVRLSARVLGVLAISLVSIVSWAQLGVGDQPADRDVGAWREAVVQRILAELGRKYHHSSAGLSFEVWIKDFNPNNDYTYAVIDELKTVWQITLPETSKRNLGVEDVCVCKAFSVEEVRKDLIATIKQSGLRRQFTVPQALGPAQPLPPIPKPPRANAGKASGASPAEREARLRLRDVVFVDPQRGWTVGSQGTVLATADGGISWQLKHVTSEDMHRAAFVSAPEGWVVGTGGLLLHTHDGGRSWTRKALPTNARLLGLRFVSPDQGWTVGNSGLIFATSDGGQTWRRQQSGTAKSLYDIACFSRLDCLVVGSEGTVLATHDGGTTWTPRQMPLDSVQLTVLGPLVVTDDQTAWVVGGWNKSGYLLRSDDRGKTWRVVSQAFPDLPTGLFFWDRMRGAVVSAGIIMLTVDGGSTWKKATIPNEAMPDVIFFLDDRYGWAVGAWRTILHTRDGGETWTLQHRDSH